MDVLTVWASKRRYGPGETFVLYGAEGTAELTDRPYVLVLRFLERREGPLPGRAAAAAASHDSPVRLLRAAPTDGVSPDLGASADASADGLAPGLSILPPTPPPGADPGGFLSPMSGLSSTLTMQRGLTAAGVGAGAGLLSVSGPGGAAAGVGGRMAPASALELRYSRLGAEVRQQLLLRAQSTDMSAAFSLPEVRMRVRVMKKGNEWE
ncbi:hypothetical protein GPECTOR_2g1415 [Gonium pectorale]|uniref:Uncharacterized protein n=1 Tax=Gonium pectorale TaxID=33097 RepID=A0A150H1E0_GONPE|nr:hypothetical protein GPECTOR_2g1415 [Gonium pectorale]|eukprot:KXZ55864.1 hypothetical protein GPECTOR_2g1415 [Gonium pectorale]